MKKVLEFIVCSNQAFLISESPHLRDLLEYLNPEAKLPTHKTISNHLKIMYEREKAEIKQQLKVNDKTLGNTHLKFLPFETIAVSIFTGFPRKNLFYFGLLDLKKPATIPRRHS